MIEKERSVIDTLNEITTNPKHKPKDDPNGFQTYRAKLDEALACFHHQVIFDPKSNTMKYLTPVTSLERKFCESEYCIFGVIKKHEEAKQTQEDINVQGQVSHICHRQLIRVISIGSLSRFD